MEIIYLSIGLLVGLALAVFLALFYNKEIKQLRAAISGKEEIIDAQNRKETALTADNKALTERIAFQREEMDGMRKEMNREFEHIASRILEEKSQRFTKLNRDNLDSILKPLGDNLTVFKKQIEEVYDKESKERFSLGKEVERLVSLNQKISEEANSLTKALKGESKVQGNWGELILENILERSGLTKGQEYEVQEFLKDEQGNFLKNETGSRMQPDVVVYYPDERRLIIDSKVSLTDYARCVESDDPEMQQQYIAGHIRSVRKHVDELSAKNYQAHVPGLDFVMMFVPNEPAYLLAMQHDSELWYYAYRKRIILMSPTNLIPSLKLIENLWKREYQSRNAQEIADRGAKLYDKFVGFMENLEQIGTHIDKAQKSYSDAVGQLRDGRGNLISQAEKLKELGVKPKKELKRTSP